MSDIKPGHDRHYWSAYGGHSPPAVPDDAVLGGKTLSVRLRTREPDHLGPLVGLVSHELAEVCGRTHEHCAAQVGKARLDLGVPESRINFFVELIHDFGGRVLGCTNAKDKTRLVIRHEITDGRDVW